MTVPLSLDDLGDQSLVDLAARLAAELHDVEGRRAQLEQLIKGGSRRLLKPGAKLSLNTACAVIGLAMAPWTLGLSLGVSVVSAVVTAWDAMDYGADAARIIRVRLQIRELRAQATEIGRQLREVEDLLTIRGERRQHPDGAT